MHEFPPKDLLEQLDEEERREEASRTKPQLGWHTRQQRFRVGKKVVFVGFAVQGWAFRKGVRPGHDACMTSQMKD